MSTTHPPKALLFDVFGTVVDWRSTITNALITHCADALSAPEASLPSAVRLRASTMTAEDWGTFAQQWRTSYMTFTATHDPALEFISVDAHHLTSLHSLLQTWQLSGLWPDAEVQQISLQWHNLTPWPDSPAGIRALNDHFVTCTLSNGNVALLTDLAAHADLPFAHLLSAEHFAAYKPSRRVYEGAARRLGLQVGECALVAAHLADLRAARGCGFQTVYVGREGEEGWGVGEVGRARAEGWVDMWVGVGEGGFGEVVRRFEAGVAGGEGVGVLGI